MPHLIASKTAVDERASLARSVKSHLLNDLELDPATALYGQYVETLTRYFETLLGIDTIVKSFSFWRRPSSATKLFLAEYINARVNNRFTDRAEHSLISSAGQKQAEILIEAVDTMLKNKREILELLAEFATAYVDESLDITSENQRARVKDSKANLYKKIGKKRADELMDIVYSRIDAELNDYLVRMGKHSWAGTGSVLSSVEAKHRGGKSTSHPA